MVNPEVVGFHSGVVESHHGSYRLTLKLQKPVMVEAC
jgi:hypothetical protein